MKVLVLDEWIPYPLDCGKKIRTYNLLRQLSRAFDITLMGYADAHHDEALDAMRNLGIHVVPIPDNRLRKWSIPFFFRVFLNFFEKVPFSTVYHIQSDFQRAILDFVKKESPSIIHCEWTNLAPLLDGLDFAKTVIASHNIESDIWFRLAQHSRNPFKKILAYNQARKIKALEQFWYPRAAYCTAVSEQDNAVIQRYGARSCVVANGVDVGYYSSIAPVDNGDVIVFTASYDTFSNQDGVHFFLDDIWGRIKRDTPTAQMYFVGKHPTERMKSAAANDASIHFTGWVEDVRPFIAKAKVCVVPLRIAGGSRLKILEAMAMNKPIVSTVVGAEGIDVTDGKDILLRDDPSAFADAVTSCLRSKTLCGQLGHQAFVHVQAHYDWAALAKKQEAVWRAVGHI